MFKVEEWTIIFYENSDPIKVGGAMLISDKQTLKKILLEIKKNILSHKKVNPSERYNNYKYICA